MSNDLGEVQTPRVEVADVIHRGEKLILPEGMNIGAAIDLLHRRQQYLETETELNETFAVFPWDGANALSEVLKARYGWAPATPTPGMFGMQRPPKLINIEVGVGQTKQIPWGRFTLPNVEGFVDCGATKKRGRIVFVLSAEITRKDEPTVQALFDDVRAYLIEHSLYRGKALKVRFRDDNGQPVPLPEPVFMDTDIDRDSLIFSEDTEAAMDTSLFTPIERIADCEANDIEIKRGVLLAGTYGVGKSMAAKVAANIATQTGLTFLYVTRADELADAVEFGKMYQNPACVVFCEDIDRATSGERNIRMDDILNVIDGIDTKQSNIMTVLTTNHLEDINPAMLRPGRLDAVIEITAPDAKAAQRLLRYYGGDAISASTKLNSVGEELSGMIPAVIAEVVKRAKLAQLRRQAPGEIVKQITEEALLEAAKSMRAQTALLSQHKPDYEPTIDDLLNRSVTDSVNKAFNGAQEQIAEIHKQVIS